MALDIQPSISIDRMFQAMERVKARLTRAVRVLREAGIDYAVIGGHAVAKWVASVDESRQRNTRDVDILVRRADLNRIIAAMKADGFIYSHVWDVHLFMEDEKTKAGEGVHLIFENEKIKLDSITPAASLSEAEAATDFTVLGLEALLRMKLEANRPKDQAHVVDLLNVGLIDESWPARYPSPLRERLEALVNDPNNRQPI